MKEIHQAYEKYIELIKVIPIDDLKAILSDLKIKQDKTYNQILLISEELKRRDLK